MPYINFLKVDLEVVFILIICVLTTVPVNGNANCYKSVESKTPLHKRFTLVHNPHSKCVYKWVQGFLV